MGMTIAEKIIALAAGVPEVKAGDIHTVTLDRMMSNDGTTHLTVDMYHNKLKHPRIADPKKMVFIVDHNVPSDSPKTAASQKKMRDFARENGIDFWEGKGVCHQIMMENYVCPGELIFGADSHTCTYGALGAFGTGVGCTDLLYGMVTGTSWVLVPETVRFNLTGKLPEGVYPRDLMLAIIGQIKGILTGINCIRITLEDCFRFSATLFQIFQSHIVCLEDGSFCTSLYCKVTQYHTIADT